jgi:hypothetical protein
LQDVWGRCCASFTAFCTVHRRPSCAADRADSQTATDPDLYASNPARQPVLHQVSSINQGTASEHQMHVVYSSCTHPPASGYHFCTMDHGLVWEYE